VKATDEKLRSDDERDEFVVTLRLFGDDLDPDEITQLLGATPTAAVRRGDLRHWSTGSCIERQGSWRLTAGGRSTTDIEAQSVSLFERLTADLSVWRSLTARFEADLFCGVFHAYQAHCLEFSPRFHRLLADRNITLILDIYAGDGPDENA
jgi:Domain of unknown function (DUF4279)